MIQHMDQIAEEFISQDTHGLITKAIGAAAGSERLYVNIDRIPPESFSTKYHSHSQQEEFFLVLSGNGTVRLNDILLQRVIFSQSPPDRILRIPYTILAIPI